MPLGFPVAGCCGSCDGNGAPNTISVGLAGYTGTYASLNGSWVLYAEAWDTGECSYLLKNGPARPDPNGLVNTDGVSTLYDYRASIKCAISGSTITVTVIDGSPGSDPPGDSGGGSQVSRFTGSIGAVPTNCLQISQTVPLDTTVGGSGTPTCTVAAGGPGRHCIHFNGCLDSSGNANTGSAGGAGGSSSPLPKLRQPGRSKNCRQSCECGCVCDARMRPKQVTVQFQNFDGGYPNPNYCTTFFNGVKYTLDYLGVDGQGNCLYGIDTKNLNYYLVAILGFPGEPSDRGVFARVEFHRGDVATGTLEYAFELDHLEWQTNGYTWGGPGTFPCPGQGWTLPMVMDYGNLTDNNTLGGPCITSDLRHTTCTLNTSGDYTGLASVSCCCGGAPDGGRYNQDLYICFQSEDPACQKLNGVLVQLENTGGVNWSATTTLDDGSTLSVNLTYSGGSWHGYFGCPSAVGPISFSSINSSTSVSSAYNDCCTGSLTLTLTDHPVACGGNLTSGAAGCCNCPNGTSPPNNLLVTIPGVNKILDFPINANGDSCNGCAGVMCDQAGSYVLDYNGLAPLPNCQGGCNPCSRCFYSATFPLGHCEYNGVVYAVNLTVYVWIDWQGNVTVQTSVGSAPDCGTATVIWQGNTTPAACPSFNISVPISGPAGLGQVCYTSNPVQVQSL